MSTNHEQSGKSRVEYYKSSVKRELFITLDIFKLNAIFFLVFINTNKNQ